MVATLWEMESEWYPKAFMEFLALDEKWWFGLLDAQRAELPFGNNWWDSDIEILVDVIQIILESYLEFEI